MLEKNPSRALFYLWLVFSLLFSPLTAVAAVGELPANLIISPQAGAHYVVLVEKSSQRLFIYRFDDGDYQLVVSYKCATGENEGEKQISGDRKTPEGVYFFTKAVDERHLTPIYGARAFPMDYPNLLDQRLGKGGDGIWVHGTNQELKERSTNGCVALSNEDVVRLDEYVRLWDTPIIIERNLRYETRADLSRQGHQFLELVEGWRQAWSGMDLDRYLAYYAADFRWQGLDLHGWRQRKQRLNQQYRLISVQLSDIRFFRHGNAVTATFQQVYRSDRFGTHGAKRLYLTQNSQQWRILGEDFRQSARPQPPALVATAKIPETRELPEDVLHRFVQNWRSAWEKGDFPDYMSCYHPDFRSQGMDLQGWKRYKEALFEASDRRTVQLSDISIKIRDASAVVTFTQDYRTDRHQDYGVKTLRLRQQKGRWTIYRESWRPLPQRG